MTEVSQLGTADIILDTLSTPVTNTDWHPEETGNYLAPVLQEENLEGKIKRAPTKEYQQLELRPSKKDLEQLLAHLQKVAGKSGGVETGKEGDALQSLIPFLETAKQMEKSYSIPIESALLLEACQKGIGYIDAVKTGRPILDVAKDEFQKFIDSRHFRLADKDQLPYIVAFAGGMMANKSGLDLANVTRDLIASKITGDKTEVKNCANGITQVIFDRLSISSGHAGKLRFTQGLNNNTGDIKLS